MPETKTQDSFFSLSDETKETLKIWGLYLLTGGASLVLGLLSFGGMYAVWPLLIPSLVSFFLCVVYEAEIYVQNLTRAFQKITQPDYFERQLPNYYFLRYFEETLENADCIQFFKDYDQALNQEEDTQAFKDIFAEYIEATSDEDLDDKVLYRFLHQKNSDSGTSIHEDYLNSKERRVWLIPFLKAFSILTAFAMTLGTIYLLAEACTIIPWLAAIPATVAPMIILPLALVGGLAYGLLTFNAITNFMANDTFMDWYRRIRRGFQKDGFTLKNGLMLLSTGVLFSLALVLTLCTAGTWLTIAREVKPLFSWMQHLPKVIMHVINPIIMWISSFSFNIENTSGTLHGLFSEEKDPHAKSWWEKTKNAAGKTYEQLKKETWGQRLNPFRPITHIILFFRNVLFAGHLASVGATADRIPGVDKKWSFGIGFGLEWGEDHDYFYGHDHPTDSFSRARADLGESQGHCHGEDIPFKMLKAIAYPFFYASAMWDEYWGGEYNPVSFEESWERQHGPFFEEHATDSTCGPNCSHTQFPTYQHRAPTGATQQADAKTFFEDPSMCGDCAENRL